MTYSVDCPLTWIWLGGFCWAIARGVWAVDGDMWAVQREL